MARIHDWSCGGLKSSNVVWEHRMSYINSGDMFLWTKRKKLRNYIKPLNLGLFANVTPNILKIEFQKVNLRWSSFTAYRIEKSAWNNPRNKKGTLSWDGLFWALLTSFQESRKNLDSQARKLFVIWMKSVQHHPHRLKRWSD